jgi:thiol:disulfide interchange protein DsbC
MRQYMILLMATCFVGGAFAQTPAAKADPKADPKADQRATIAGKFDGINVEDVRMSPVGGVYEISRGAEITYVTADGRYAFAGDLIDVDGDANLTENRRRSIRARMIEDVPASQMLVFAPGNPKHVVTVFTDIDCGYCRRMHSQIAEYNRLGIEVRYLFFPRSGPSTESWRKAESVWCSADRNAALTRAKKGETVNAPKCTSDIVKRDFELGVKLNVKGTPAIFLASGEELPGYAPPADLLKYLKTGKW